MNTQDFYLSDYLESEENNFYNGTFLAVNNNENVIFDAYQMEDSFVQLYDKINEIEKENVQSYSDSIELFFMNNMDPSHMNYMYEVPTSAYKRA